MYYEEPWKHRPPELLHRWQSWEMTDLDDSLPASMRVTGWHFRAWEESRGSDPYYLYAPDGELVGRWEKEPSLSDLFDCFDRWRRAQP